MSEKDAKTTLEHRATYFRAFRWNDWFFRVRGYGLSIQPLSGHHPLFTERYGYRKTWHGLGLCWQLLRRKRVR